MIQPSNHTCSNFMTEQDMLHLEQTNNSNSNLKVIKKFSYSNITNKIIKLNISEKRQGVCNFKIETKNASTKQNMIQLITTFPDWQSQILAVSSVLPVYSLSSLPPFFSFSTSFTAPPSSPFKPSGDRKGVDFPLKKIKEFHHTKKNTS